GYSHAIGVIGPVIAAVPVVLPSFILMIFISRFFLKYQKHPAVESVFRGLRPGVVGLLAAAALVLMNGENFGNNSYQVIISSVLFAGTFIASYRYKINPILLIIIAGVIGYLCY
ncbi:MAG: chromate transporter, partial [Phocaeicola sp.]